MTCPGCRNCMYATVALRSKTQLIGRALWPIKAIVCVVTRGACSPGPGAGEGFAHSALHPSVHRPVSPHSQLPSRLHVDSLEYVRALSTAPGPATQRPAGVSTARETLRLLCFGIDNIQDAHACPWLRCVPDGTPCLCVSRSLPLPTCLCFYEVAFSPRDRLCARAIALGVEIPRTT